MFKRLIAISLLMFCFQQGFSNAACVGRFVNPISDVCWNCLFPITIGSTQVMPSSIGLPDVPNNSMPICGCQAPPPLFYRIGLSIGYWEPSALTDVTRQPFCMVNLGMQIDVGIKMQETGNFSSSWHYGSGHTEKTFYWVHWYKYPLISWLELFMDAGCVQNGSFDLAYFAEIDPMWDDDTMAFILNPEAILFGNPIAQLACSLDAMSSTSYLPQDALFWCAGSQGSIYPFTGSVTTTQSPPSQAIQMVERMNAKLHREGAVLESNPAYQCYQTYVPTTPKSRYRYQFTNPIPQSQTCFQYGKTTQILSDQTENPMMASENFGILNWKKRNCCYA